MLHTLDWAVKALDWAVKGICSSVALLVWMPGVVVMLSCFVFERSKTSPKSAMNAPRANLKRPSFYSPRIP